MVLIAWLHNTSKALPVPLHVYSIITALLAMPYGHMALWFQVYSTSSDSWSIPVDTAISGFPGSASLCKLPGYK